MAKVYWVNNDDYVSLARAKKAAKREGVSEIKVYEKGTDYQLPSIKVKNPVSSVKSGGWVPCHAVRVVGDQIELLTEGRQKNPSNKRKFKAMVGKLKRAIKRSK